MLYRTFLDREETSVDHLEQKLEKALKMCMVSVDSGKEYVKNQRWVIRDNEYEKKYMKKEKKNIRSTQTECAIYVRYISI